jgi:hypothetical protein
LPFVWKDYLDLARHLENDVHAHTIEAAQRSAVSRAYYAAFCHARKHAARTLGYAMRRTGEDHEAVPKYLKSKGLGKTAGRLEQLKLFRNQCDYDDVVGNLHFLATTAIALAQEIIDSLI